MSLIQVILIAIAILLLFLCSCISYRLGYLDAKKYYQKLIYLRKEYNIDYLDKIANPDYYEKLKFDKNRAEQILNSPAFKAIEESIKKDCYPVNFKTESANRFNDDKYYKE
jgi:hypothetical protein